jgi:hypothetical protein
MVDPSFVPTCSCCAYDLRGIPDGVCPECGRAFEHQLLEDAARQSWAKTVAYRRVSPDAILLAFALPALLMLPSLLLVRTGQPSSVEFWSLFLWIGTSYWAWRGRWVIFRPSPIRLAWLIFPVLYAALPFGSGRPSLEVYFAISSFGACLVALAWACTTPRKWWIPLALAAWVVLAPSAMCVLVGGTRMTAGLTWSHVRDVREGQIYRQYPLRNDELVLMGLSGASTGLALAGTALAVGLRQRPLRRCV